MLRSTSLPFSSVMVGKRNCSSLMLKTTEMPLTHNNSLPTGFSAGVRSGELSLAALELSDL